MRGRMKELRLLQILKGINLVDRLLVLFMMTLMFQIAFTLFISKTSTITSEVDVIIRTTAASIFGYFLSSNFTKNCNPSSKCTVDQSRSRKNNKCTKQQIVIVGGFGIIALIILLIASNCGLFINSNIAVVSQLRDFVSSSVGYLVGSTYNDKSTDKDTKL